MVKSSSTRSRLAGSTDPGSVITKEAREPCSSGGAEERACSIASMHRLLLTKKRS